MIGFLLMAAASGSVIDAERAFAADAARDGQWTAFRRWAAPDAMMFVPQPVKAQDWLKDRQDPPKSVEWWPTASYRSCDGRTAVNTGGWQAADGSVGYFTTAWQQQADGSWKWLMDSGDGLTAPRPRPAQPVTKQAACKGGPTQPPLPGGSDRDFRTSADLTLGWGWIVRPDGARHVFVGLWDGTRIADVVDDQIAAPAK